YKRLLQFAERLLRIPATPEHPPGDEHTAQIFQAAPNFYKYLLAKWALITAALLTPFTMLAALPAIGGFALMKRGNKWAMLLFVLSFLILCGFLLVRLFALAIVRLDFEKRWYVV